MSVHLVMGAGRCHWSCCMHASKIKSELCRASANIGFRSTIVMRQRLPFASPSSEAAKEAKPAGFALCVSTVLVFKRGHKGPTCQAD